MPRVAKNKYQALITRIAFLSVNGSDAALAKVRLMMETLELFGVNEETRTSILEQAQELADTANE